MVLTLDFFPPIVDDPFTYGEIAAANALSDVFAVGGTPVAALNIFGFPSQLPLETASLILEGGASKAGEANTPIVGGHTLEDDEPKYGLAVTGVIKPEKQITNSNAMTGDLLVLTKAIGTGVITTALKNAPNMVDKNDLDAAIFSMTTLNNSASKCMISSAIQTATDVTGFGLLGHLHKMMNASGQSAIIWNDKIPVLNGTRELIKKNIHPGGTSDNLEFIQNFVDFSSDITTFDKKLLADPQTSGGILMSVPENKLTSVVKLLEVEGTLVSQVIGEVVKKTVSSILVKTRG